MEIDLNRKCRACLAEDQPMFSLFQEYEHNITLANILQDFITQDIREDDGMPTHLCDNCILILTQFYNFTVVFEESQKRLRQCILESKSVLFDLDTNPRSVDISEDELVENGEQGDTVEVLQTNLDNIVVYQVEDAHNMPVDHDEDVFTDDVQSEDYCDDDEPLPTKTEFLTQEENRDKGNVVKIEQSESKQCRRMPRFIVKDNETFEEIVKYECNVCGDVHLFEQNFHQHMKKKHALSDINATEHSQTILLKVPPNPNENNTTRTKRIDKPRLEIRCKTCNKLLHSPQALQQHVKLHDANKKFVCDVCGTRFSRKTYLVDHLESHSTECKHKCKFCGKAFKRRTVLRAHIRVHTHPNFYACELCGRRFTNSSTLKTHHYLIHVRERKFKCMICDLDFPLKATLNKHLLRHQKRENGEKGFGCTECGMQYKDKSSLKRHTEAKHLGKLPMVLCLECPKMYTSKANLAKHRRKYHSDSNVQIPV